MTTRLDVSPLAESDIDDILAYLEREAGIALADGYAVRIAKAIERLIEFPRSGSPRPALGFSVRVEMVLPYLIIYDYDAVTDTIVLLRILHGRRNITQRLMR